ncbi:MAG: glycosyltransferase [Paludibacteraceae bacterium]|nr:glycosyltransferase [Paludibacteraceae bacterium]
MSKVLIISAPFFGYQNSVGKAFQALGFDVRIETYDEPIHPFKGILRWRHKLAINKEPLREKSRLKYKQYIENVFDEYKPDIVFTYNGTILKDSTLDYFRNGGAKVIVWMYDSVQRPDREMCISHVQHADLFCCFEEKDVEFFEKQGEKAYFLPLACDTEVYYKQDNVKDIDILFVGTIYTSPKRILLLEKIARKYSNRKILFYGEYKPYFKNPIKWLFRGYRDVFLNHNIAPSIVNDLFSRSRIVLNIHHKQTFHGANQRLFEACGAGAYQICDKNPFIASLFQNGEVGLYDNEEELFELIDYALTHDMSQNAKAGYEIVLNNHTFDKRIEQMLELLK